MISFCVLFWYYKIVLLTSFYPLIVYQHRHFMSLNVTELFLSITESTLYVCCLILFNQSRFQISLFFNSVWSYFQIKLFNILFRLCYVAFFILYFWVNLIVTPRIINFFLSWEIKNKYNLLQITTESRLDSYLSWILTTNFFISNTLVISMFFIFWAIILFGSLLVYLFVQNYKTQIIFSIFSILSFFLSLDVFSQLFFLGTLISFLELTMFFLAILISYSINA